MFFSFIQPRALGLIVLGLVLGVVMTIAATQFFATRALPLMAPPEDPVAAEPEVLYWYDPMVPAQHFDQPGKSPFMDMDLVPKYAETGTAMNTLVVDSGMVQNLGIRTATVMRKPLRSQYELPASLHFNERNQAVIQLRAAGFVEKTWPLALGDHVIAGQPIATFYVPEWLNTQNELLASTTIKSPRLLETLRAKLRLQGMPEELIAKVEATLQPQTRVTITAPITGVIESLEIKMGMSLANGQTLARISSIDSLWLDVAIPEAQVTGLQLGDAAIFYAPNAEPVSGTIDSILPAANDMTRTVTARVVLPNPQGVLRPGISGHVVLTGSQTYTGLMVPTEAVIRTGKRTLVMVADDDNHFRPVMITLGQEIGDQTVITQGLEEGQAVVVSGQFLLDSEASLLGIVPDDTLMPAASEESLMDEESESTMEMQP